jgi:hypothetical protein
MRALFNQSTFGERILAVIVVIVVASLLLIWAMLSMTSRAEAATFPNHAIYQCNYNYDRFFVTKAIDSCREAARLVEASTGVKGIRDKSYGNLLAAICWLKAATILRLTHRPFATEVYRADRLIDNERTKSLQLNSIQNTK